MDKYAGLTVSEKARRLYEDIVDIGSDSFESREARKCAIIDLIEDALRWQQQPQLPAARSAA